MADDFHVPVTICWHCDRALDGAANMPEQAGEPHPGAISLCFYCGAVAVFGPDLRLRAPSKELLDGLQEDWEFMKQYMNFMWARRFVMLKTSLMRSGEDPDR